MRCVRMRQSCYAPVRCGLEILPGPRHDRSYSPRTSRTAPPYSHSWLTGPDRSNGPKTQMIDPLALYHTHIEAGWGSVAKRNIARQWREDRNRRCGLEINLYTRDIFGPLNYFEPAVLNGGWAITANIVDSALSGVYEPAEIQE